MIEREKIIKNYIDGYNQFDIDRMVIDFDDNIIFENIQNDVRNMSLVGLNAFRDQAKQAKIYFTERTQSIKSIKHFDNKTEIEIDYKAILDMDLPNGLNKGKELNMVGKSVFVFENEKIIKLTDIS